VGDSRGSVSCLQNAAMKRFLCSMLLHLFVTPLPYNAVAARGLLGRTDKNIICHFLATEVAVYFYNNKRLL